MFNIFNNRLTNENLELFAEQLTKLSDQIGFKISARGWCYQLENSRLINKDQFDRVESVINKCRKKGILSIDFVAEEEGRQFSGVEIEENETPLEYLRGYLEAPLQCHDWYTPDWWKEEKYYIQMLVEKIDLKTLFSPVCKEYHIPIATSKGWSSMLQRAIYARRFKEAEEKDLSCVLLYCGDHDPDGLRISDFLRSNLYDISGIEWGDRETGYDPSNLTIKRFGLDAPFIEKHNLTWIDNLITGSKKDLGNPSHKNFNMPYVQKYIQQFGKRKCEANAIVPMPKEARKLVEDAIISFVGEEAIYRFAKHRLQVKATMNNIRERVGLTKILKEAIKLIDEQFD